MDFLPEGHEFCRGFRSENMKRILFSLMAWLAVGAGTLPAQYSLDETGISFGGGARLLTGAGSMKAEAGFNASFFYSHYVCGKRWGFHFEGGYGGHAGSLHGLYLPTEDPIDPYPSLSMHSGELAALFKLRTVTYHRRSETAFLMGPQLSVLWLPVLQPEIRNLFEDRNGRFTTFNPGVHFSLWLRRPLGEEQSLFIRPGALVNMLPLYQVNGNRVSGYYLFLNLGFTIWNSH